MQLPEAIYHLQPLAEFKVNGDAVYASIEWLNPAVEMPTKAEILALFPAP